jgi:hypothetical protein
MLHPPEATAAEATAATAEDLKRYGHERLRQRIPDLEAALQQVTEERDKARKWCAAEIEKAVIAEKALAEARGLGPARGARP